MSESEKIKTPWKKNIDHRYISGEDLADGIAMNKGLRPEMVVTFTKFNDAPAFDQKQQKEIDKTAIWLKEFPSGKMIYKPCLLNLKRGAFLSKEIGNNSMFIDDFSHEKPFIIYAEPSARFGYVVGFKKYNPHELIMGSDNFNKCKEALKSGKFSIEDIKLKYTITKEMEDLLNG